jgi:hypothetical protein
MAVELTDKVVKALAPPPAGNRITYDTKMSGFGCRVTSAGARSFVLNYRTKAGGRERRITIGSFPDWTVKAAREKAAEYRRQVDDGADPMGSLHAKRAAETVVDLVNLYRKHRLPEKRPRSAAEDERNLRLHVLSALGKLKVADVRQRDIAALHREISKTAPIAANRVISLLHAVFALAVRDEMRADNPVRDIERNHEEKRERFLTATEIAKLIDVLNGHANVSSANVIRLLLLTGARRGEVLGASWDQFDLQADV